MKPQPSLMKFDLRINLLSSMWAVLPLPSVGYLQDLDSDLKLRTRHPWFSMVFNNLLGLYMSLYGYIRYYMGEVGWGVAAPPSTHPTSVLLTRTGHTHGVGRTRGHYVRADGVPLRRRRLAVTP